jgi:hypothetical protein
MEVLFYCIGFLLVLGCIGGIPVFIVGLLFHDWHRAERMQENMEYDPESVLPVNRFCTGEEMRKRGW